MWCNESEAMPIRIVTIEAKKPNNNEESHVSVPPVFLYGCRVKEGAFMCISRPWKGPFESCISWRQLCFHELERALSTKHVPVALVLSLP